MGGGICLSLSKRWHTWGPKRKYPRSIHPFDFRRKTKERESPKLRPAELERGTVPLMTREKSRTEKKLEELQKKRMKIDNSDSEDKRRLYHGKDITRDSPIPEQIDDDDYHLIIRIGSTLAQRYKTWIC